VKSPAVDTDIMSYCYDWISDYTYHGMIDFRAGVPAAAAEAPTQAVLISGNITSDAVHLSPSFIIETPPVVPTNSGPYLLEGLDASGNTLFQYRFTANAIDHAADVTHFTFAIPLSDATRDALVTIRASGPSRTTAAMTSAAGRAALLARLAPSGIATPASVLSAQRATSDALHVQWDAGTWAGVMVRDPDTNEVLGFGTGGDVMVRTAKSRVVVLLSDGVQSATRTVTLP
jgi:hypothetical protein